MVNKVVNILLAVMFLGFAYLQLNDPDPVIWTSIYVAVAIVCALAAFNYYNRIVLWAMTVLYALYSLVYLPGAKVWFARDDKAQLFDNVAKMEHPFIEESREFLGLGICIIVLVIYLFRSRKK